MSVGPINFNFFEKPELNVEVFLNKCQNFLLSPTLLPKELIARESQDFKPFLVEFVIHANHGFIVFTGQSSLASYIDNHDHFFIFVGVEINESALDVLDFEIEEGLRDVARWEGLRS